MKRRSSLPKGVLSRLPVASRYLSRHALVEFACLFGSLARRATTTTSDIDIAVYLSPAANKTKAKMEILGVLTDIFQTDEIDLVVLNTAPISLRGRILKDRWTIAERNPFLRHRYESLTMREFFDFSVRETAILEGRYLHGR